MGSVLEEELLSGYLEIDCVGWNEIMSLLTSNGNCKINVNFQKSILPPGHNCHGHWPLAMRKILVLSNISTFHKPEPMHSTEPEPRGRPNENSENNVGL